MAALARQALSRVTRQPCLRGRNVREIHHTYIMKHASERVDENYDPVLAEVKDPSHPYPGVGPVKGPQLDPAVKGDTPDDSRGGELHWAEPKEHTMQKAEEITRQTWETGALKDLSKRFNYGVTSSSSFQREPITKLSSLFLQSFGSVSTSSALSSEENSDREVLYPPSAEEDIGFVDEEIWSGEHIGSEASGKANPNPPPCEINVSEEGDWVWWHQNRCGFPNHFGIYSKKGLFGRKPTTWSEATREDFP